MSNAPVDKGQLWAAPVDYASDALSKAAIAEADAQKLAGGVAFAGEDNKAFYERRAEEARFAAQRQAADAQAAKADYDAAYAGTRQHNEPIEAQLRAAEEARTAAMAADTAKFMATAVAATVVAAEVKSPGMATSAFGNMFGLHTPATTMSMGPAALFGALAATPAKLGMEPSLDKQLGPVMPAVAIDNVAKASPIVAAEMAAPAVVAPAAPRTNVSFELHNNAMANGPSKPTWARNGTGGGSPGA